MRSHPIEAVSFDALGTLMALEPPAPRLRRALRRTFGLEVSEAEAERAVAAEIAYYRAHLHEGSDRATLAELRRRCAAVLRDALPPAELELERLTGVLLEAIRFRAYPDAAPALQALRARGLRLVAVSNWDVSLHEQLAATGLAGLLDAALSSAEAGAAKPEPAIFRRALALVGVAPGMAWHVGDEVAADVEGAGAAGLEPVLIDRGRGEPPPPGVRVIASLGELPALCA
jgi:putative hydrolase of the HAD superfamily